MNCSGQSFVDVSSPSEHTVCNPYLCTIYYLQSYSGVLVFCQVKCQPLYPEVLNVSTSNRILSFANHSNVFSIHPLQCDVREVGEVYGGLKAVASREKEKRGSCSEVSAGVLGVLFQSKAWLGRTA